MPDSEVTLVISDFTNNNDGKKFELPHISVTSNIIEVKKSILQALALPDQDPESIVVFIGTIHLDDQKILKDYNKSNRSKLQVNVYERVLLNLRVRTLQESGIGGCVCVPFWSFLCRQTIHINISDRCTVGELKEMIVEELDDPDRFTVENLKLTFKHRMLFEDEEVLRDLGMQKGSKLTLFVDFCYWTKSNKPAPEKNGEPEHPHVEDEDAKEDGAAEDAAADEAAEHKESNHASDEA